MVSNSAGAILLRVMVTNVGFLIVSFMDSSRYNHNTYRHPKSRAWTSCRRERCEEEVRRDGSLMGAMRKETKEAEGRDFCVTLCILQVTICGDFPAVFDHQILSVCQGPRRWFHLASVFSCCFLIVTSTIASSSRPHQET